MSPRPVPPPLESYLTLPPELSQLLLTSTLGCSINWLTARHISTLLTSSPPNSVILVSWLRSFSFWKNEIRRTTGLDISKPGFKERFTFIDNFSNPKSLHEIEKDVLDATSKSHILILDNPDVLLINTPSHSLNTFILTLRSHAHATILTTSADLPFLSAATSNAESRPTPLECETAAFITSQAHASRLVMSVRELETGAARDVSGVLRVTRGGDFYGEGEGEVREEEFLFLVHRDGGVKVFKRGAGE